MTGNTAAPIAPATCAAVVAATTATTVRGGYAAATLTLPAPNVPLLPPARH